MRGQYGAGQRDGEPVLAYRQESGIAPASTTETYVAIKLAIDNWRWASVPFFLRTGKRLSRRVSEIAVTFKGGLNGTSQGTGWQPPGCAALR